MKSSDGEVRDQREDDRSDKEVCFAPNLEGTSYLDIHGALSMQLSLDEVYQIIDEFLEEDRLNRDGRSNSLSKGESIVSFCSSLWKLAQFVHEFVLENEEKKIRMIIFSADEFIYAPRSGGWMLPEDLEENEKRLSDEQSEFEDLLECFKDKDNKLPVGLSTSTSAKQGKNRRNRKRRSEVRNGDVH